ncbi:DUF4259 domain-containing protein [Acidovorax sp. LjRoot194]|uniref:DUF4259 domain-containing protein n=1 Tax=Acidovorax sp. LjRoot194 TaxID=3342280 RepID=UPI003ECE3C70
MGAWSHQSFGNDAALDWVSHLEKSSSLKIVEITLQNVMDVGLRPLDATTAGEAIAASEVVASLLGRPGSIDAYSESVDRWVKSMNLVPSKALLETALLVLDRIEIEPSELRDLWLESGELAEWSAAVQDLRTRLTEKPARLKRRQSSEAHKKTGRKLLERGDLFEVLTHSGKSLIGQVLEPEPAMHICILNCSGDSYRVDPDSIRLAQSIFEGKSTGDEFMRGNWVWCGHAEAREFHKPFHIVNTNDGLVLRDFDRTVIRLATEKDEAMYGFESYFSGATFTNAVSRYFIDGLDAVYGNIDVRRLREQSNLT